MSEATCSWFLAGQQQIITVQCKLNPEPGVLHTVLNIYAPLLVVLGDEEPVNKVKYSWKQKEEGS